jgi:hypothetical protein
MKQTSTLKSRIFNLPAVTACAFFSLATLLTYFSVSASPGDAVSVNTISLAFSPPSYSIHMSPSGMGNGWGEPSIGVNWISEQTFNGTPNGGTVLTYGGFGTTALRITFDDSNPAAPMATWERTATLPLASQPRELGDPILFTDHDTGRTFVSQLLGGTPESTTDITDDDGRTFSESQGSGIVSGVDHQTIGGGPFAPPLTGSNPFYRNAIYYCSQDVGDALCALSVDGGVTFGAAVPIFTRADCNGLHGHIKVSPMDGTAYVPDKGCGGTDVTFHSDGKQAVVVSENNGATWTVRLVTTSSVVFQSLTQTSHQSWDPSVGVASDGTLYFGYQAADGHARIAVSHDKGMTWVNDTDVGALAGVQNTSFPAVVAGDPDRAAFAFFGTTTGGSDYDTAGFSGDWYLYIATTYDGGQTWTTVNPNPNDPIQRGGICGSGTCRNLLDFFDATIDKEGRVLVGYDDGCISTGCVQGTSGNDYTSKNAIARQLNGRRVFAAYDVQLDSVVSRKIHGSAGTFDIDLPLTGPAGIECRSGGATNDYSLVFTFPNNLTMVAGSSVTAGNGSVNSSAIGPNPNQYTVNVTGVNTGQYVTITLANVRDVGGHIGDVSGTMGVLVGDVNASKRVDAADVSSVRQQTLQTVTTSNFRNDINASGRIDAADVSIARQQTLTSLP